MKAVFGSLSRPGYHDSITQSAQLAQAAFAAEKTTLTAGSSQDCFVCGRRDLNPNLSRDTPLKRARMPIPPQPHVPIGNMGIIPLVCFFVKRFAEICAMRGKDARMNDIRRYRSRTRQGLRFRGSGAIMGLACTHRRRERKPRTQKAVPQDIIRRRASPTEPEWRNDS